MLSQPLCAIRRAVLVMLLCSTSNAWAITTSEEPSYDGSYRISWNSQPIGCTEGTEYPYYPYDCYTLQENGVDISASGWFKDLSGKAVGTYEYQIYDRFYLAGGLWDEYPIDGPVTVNVVPATPGTPSGPTTDYTGGYTISWSSVTGATSYRLEERVNSGSWSEIHNASGTSKAVSGKTPGTWDYRVRACASPGCGNYSSTKSVTVSAPGTPGTPSGPSGSEYTGAYSITWSTVSDATSYRLEERVNSGSWSEIYNSTGTSTSVSGKTPGTWDYRLRACSGAGCGSYSSTKSVSVSAPATPGTPTGPTDDYDGAYTIDWSAQTGATNYTLEENLNGGSWSSIHSGSAITKAVSGRSAGTWNYRVRAESGAGNSSFSSTKSVVVTLPPSSAPSTPTGPTGTEYTGAYTISWGTVGAATSYRLEERVNSGSWTEIHNASGASKAVSGKTPGSWDYQARACNVAGCSGYSSIKTVTVSAPSTPGTPSGPTGNEYTGAYTISWSSDGNATSYKLEERLNSGSWSEIHSASGTSKAVSGKTPGSWEYRLRSCSGAGCSGYSSTKTVTVSAPAAPGAPSGPGYSYGGSYTISWSAVTGAATYTLQERVNAGSWSTLHDASGTSKAVTATTYTEGTRDYQLRACSGAGCSSYSSTTSVSVILPPTTTGSAPGAIPGGFSVGTQGDASYTIPITVPAGTGGLKPSLALSYNHLAGNGLAGMRWTLSGISSITLCEQTVAQDGLSAVPGDPRYCLNGQRLVNVDGTYHLDGTEYRTEIESFQRIIQVGNLVSESPSFYVDHGNGLRSYFGENANSRVVGWGSLPRTWYISRTVDQFGNAIEYGYYAPTADEKLPQTIEWTSNEEQTLDPRYAVTITYENRPTDDQRSGYDSLGGTWSRTKRIDEIEVSYDDGAVHEIATYALTYDATAPPSGTGRSTLTGVSVCRSSECLPATAFAVQDAASGWTTAAATDRLVSSTPLAGDWNGDGRTDLLGSANNLWYVLPGNVEGLFDSAVSTSLSAATNPGQARVFDFDGDGLADLLFQDGSSNWKVALSNGSTSSPFDSPSDSGVSVSAVPNPILQDHDGDGLTDLVYAAASDIQWRRNTGGSFASASTVYTAEVSVPSFSVGTVDSGLRSLDANGDGRADLIVEVEDCVYNPSDPYDFYCNNDYHLLLSDGSAYASVQIFSTTPEGVHNTNFRIADFNGDGLSDFMYINQDGNWSMRISTGASTTSGSTGTIPVTNASKVLIGDYDADGRDDLIRPDGHYWRIHRSSGTTLESSYSASLFSTDAASAAAFMADIAGVGQPQIVRTYNSYWYVHPRNGGLADVVTEFTDGLDRTVSVEYESLAQTDAYTLDLGHAPSEDYVRRFGGARYVVTTETHDDGVGGTRDITHEYDTAFVNTAGRGWQSFRSHTITDVIQETFSVNEYSQAFPTAGMVVSAELSTLGADDTIGTSDDRLIRSVDQELTASAITGTTPERQFVRVDEITTVEKEVGGSEDGDTLRTIVDDPEYDATYGFVTDTTRTVTQPGVTGAWVTLTEFDRGVIDGAGQWCLGLPGTVETSSSLPGGSPVSRSVDYQYDSDDCSVYKVTDLSEGSDTTKQLVREFGFDYFGNVVSVKEYSVAAGATGARETTFDFDDDGHFPESVTVEGVNLTTLLEFDPLLGVRTSVTGPDGLETNFLYDAFGRLTQEDRPAGYTDFTYRGCAGNNCFDANAAFYVKAADSTGATSYTFFDAFQRPVGSDSPLAGGRRSRERTVYLANGRVDQRSLPYVAGEPNPVHWVELAYDGLGRVTTEADESGSQTEYEYLGNALEVTDGNDHMTRYEHNALGQIEKVIDAMEGETAYAYYPFGELHTVTDYDTNETEILYDARGFKREMDDPDMGHWYYDHNVYGELVEQTDAKAQVVTLDYDPAGRLVSRLEDVDGDSMEDETVWEYYLDTDPIGKRGRLKAVTSPGDLAEAYDYTVTSGAITATQILRSIDSVDYELDFDFDAHGRLEQITYPQNVDSQRLAVEYLYDGGVFSQVRNAATTSLVYYTLNTQDASGAVRKATFGNGVVEQYEYEPTTGQLASIKTGPSGNTALQHLDFEWDLAGNLEQRVVRNASGTAVDTDEFTYDSLDRLETVTRDSTEIMGVTYDALGNIDTKSGSSGVTGTYTYGGSRPHAVTAIGSLSFGYDGNGNMTNRAGTTVTWASFNLPSRIERSSGEYSEFLYGADRSRYVQVEGAGSIQTTRHYASPGLFEVLLMDGGTSQVDYHYIHALGRAVAQFTTSDVESDALTYLHRDHQGGVVLTTDTNGAALDRFEYDAFGVRTTTVGSDERMHRGYTGHEHLAALDLIHMNGRVQDPAIGRFLSPDPLVQAPYHSQSLNRYSYVWNNPLSMVDPSGFAGCHDDGRGNGIEDCDLDDIERIKCSSWAICLSIEDYRASELWEARTQALKETHGACAGGNGGCHAPPPEVRPLDPRVVAGIGAIGSMAEIAAGAYACGQSFGLACAVGIGAVAHGADNLYADVRTIWTGAAVEPYTVKGLRAAGVPGAPYINAGLGILLPGGAAGLAGTAARAAALSPEIGATFAGGKYTSMVLEAPMTVYRYAGGVSQAAGRFLTTAETAAQISSPAAASLALRLPVGATAETLNTFIIPAGTRVFVGGVEGGATTATQVFIENASVLIPR